MHNNEFQRILEEQFEKMRNVLAGKAEEYAADNDRLHNFKQVASLNSITIEQACQILNSKHIVSVADMVKSGEEYTMAEWDEKIGDALNYYVLLMACILEHKAADEEAAALALVLNSRR